MTETAVNIDGLSHFFGSVKVLKDITLSVKTGEFVSVVGRNGSGKSTLLRCITGLMREGKSTGSVSLFGKHVSKMSRLEIAKTAAYAPQSLSGTLPFTVLDFLRLSRYPYESSFGWTKVDDSPVLAALSEVKMRDAANRLMSTLSGGECQKIIIASVLAQETPIVLLDEPSAFLDYRHASEIGRTLRTINRRNKRTVIMITHDINRAFCHSDRIVALKKGECIFDSTPNDFMNEEVLYRIFEEHFVLAAHPKNGLPIAAPLETE